MTEEISDDEYIRKVVAYDTMREVANQLGGALLHRKRHSDDPQEQERLQTERLELRRKVDSVPGSAPVEDIEQVTSAIAQRLEEVRADK